MIPGNRPEDIAYDKAFEKVEETLDDLFGSIEEFGFDLEDLVAEWLADKLLRSNEVKREQYYREAYDRLRGEMPEEIEDDLERYLNIVATAYAQRRTERADKRYQTIRNL